MEQTVFEKLGIEYEEIDGLFYPLLEVDTDVSVRNSGKSNRDGNGNYQDKGNGRDNRNERDISSENCSGDGNGDVSSADIGKYGRMWLKFMQENEPQRYKSLYRFGKLYGTAAEVNDEAYQMLDMIADRYLQRNKPTDSGSTMEMWQIREQAKAEAEEVVLADIVNRYR